MKNIGKVVGLYPTLVVVVGVMVNGKANFCNIAHVGIIEVNKIMLSMNKRHYTNIGMKESRKCSVSIMSVDYVKEVDYVGIVSGHKVDKSKVFVHSISHKLNVPIIDNAKICMECEVVDIYESKTHDNFVVMPINTFVDESVLNEKGKIDFAKVNPLMFEMPNKKYLSLGKEAAKCWCVGKDYKKM